MSSSFLEHIKLYDRLLPQVAKHRMATTGMTLAEYLSLIGYSYYLEIKQDIPSGGALWYQFTAPADKYVWVLNRDLSPNLAGVEYVLHRNVSGFSISSPITPERFNPTQNGDPTSVANIITTPSNPGTSYSTPIFIGAGGANNANSRAGGTQSGMSGFQIYAPGTGFIAEIPNFSGGINRTRFRLEFAELPLTGD